MHELPRKKLTPAETTLREHALAFPEATEDFPWGHRAFKVNKKIFATLVSEQEITTVSVKLPKSGKAALKESFSAPTHYGMGKHGWVTMTFDVGDDLPVERLMAWIDESYRAVAPKKLVARLADASVKRPATHADISAKKPSATRTDSSPKKPAARAVASPRKLTAKRGDTPKSRPATPARKTSRPSKVAPAGKPPASISFKTLTRR